MARYKDKKLNFTYHLSLKSSRSATSCEEIEILFYRILSFRCRLIYPESVLNLHAIFFCSVSYSICYILSLNCTIFFAVDSDVMSIEQFETAYGVVVFTHDLVKISTLSNSVKS